MSCYSTLPRENCPKGIEDVALLNFKEGNKDERGEEETDKISAVWDSELCGKKTPKQVLVFEISFQGYESS